MQGRKTIKWWKCIGGMIDEYKERMKMKYEELDTEVDTVEEEWKKYKDYFVGVAEEIYGRPSGKVGKSKNQEWWRAILRYSFCRGRDILNIHPFITLSILMVETSYCTYMEAVTCVFQCVINFFCKLFQLADISITNSVSDGTSHFTNFQVTLLHAIIPLF